MWIVPQLRYPMESYLRDDSDASLPRRLATQSELPNNHLYRNHAYHGTPVDETRTSMMMSGSQDLPGWTSSTTRSTSGSVPSSVGGRQLDVQRLLVEPGPGDALHIPGLHQPRILECPFSFMSCVMTFSHVEEWIQHSLEHFRNVSPPTLNHCYFCDETFRHSEGLQSWRQRMNHVALHHSLSHRLAHARPDFQLFDYLWRKRLISDALYKDLKGNSHGQARAAGACPSSPNESSGPYTQTHSNRRRHRR